MEQLSENEGAKEKKQLPKWVWILIAVLSVALICTGAVFAINAAVKDYTDTHGWRYRRVTTE